MKTLKRKSLLGLSLMLFSSQSWALDVRDIRGEQVISSKSYRGVEERCAIPNRLAGAKYKKGDLEKEANLCGYDFYNTVALCPKFNSTNPGILITDLGKSKFTKAQIESSSCDLKAMGLKTAAKFKQSTSCSYTPSILAYYHISRALGGAGKVPVAVLRTMDAETHKKLSVKANNKLSHSTSVISKTWDQYENIHDRPRNYPEVFDSSLTQIYGALAYNVKGESIYTEVSGRGSYDTRYERFLKQRPFLNLTDSRDVKSIVGSARFEHVAQIVVQMKDISDMVIMDTLLSQQDRIGNIHYKYAWYIVSPEKKDGVDVQKSDAEIVKGKLEIPAEERAAVAGKTAALVKEMVLKDNDCGVAKSNNMRTHGALEKMRHVSYDTYKKLTELSRNILTQETKEFFLKEMLFTDKDYENTAFMARKIVSTLKQKCLAGQLKFDLDIEEYVPGAKIQTKSCEI